MRKIILASRNKNKLEELSIFLGDSFEVRTAADEGFYKEIDETEPTLEGNALLKAREIHAELGGMVIADDTGLEIDALSGNPGVLSARYAGEHGNAQKNIDKVLRELAGKDNSEAQFRTVLALKSSEGEYLFEGVVRGNITMERSGEGGFGYDPIFVPDGYTTTFAEMTIEEKNKISHRGIALQKLVDFINSHIRWNRGSI